MHRIICLVVLAGCAPGDAPLRPPALPDLAAAAGADGLPAPAADRLAPGLDCARGDGAPPRAEGSQAPAGSYDAHVLAKKPVGYWRLSSVSGGEGDLSGRGHAGSYGGASARSTVPLPNGEPAIAFDGQGQYLEVPDSDDFSASTTGAITIQAWMAPAVLQFAKSQGDYVHWMGKGVGGQHEWVSRIYNLVNSASRPNRISGYAFNLAGGLGAGSYFEDPLSKGQWIFYVLVINASAKSSAYPTGYTRIYRDGKLRDQDSLAGYDIVPKNGTAPLRIGTRDFASFFQGAIGKVAVYPRELSQAEIDDNYQAMTSP